MHGYVLCASPGRRTAPSLVCEDKFRIASETCPAGVDACGEACFTRADALPA